MPSLADRLFAGPATSNFFRMFADKEVTATYRMGDCEIRGIVCVIRQNQIDMEYDSLGDAVKHERCVMVISTNAGLPYNGVPDPQLKATWELTDVNGVSTTWATDTAPGRGIASRGPHFAEVHLLRSYAVAKSSPGSRFT